MDLRSFIDTPLYNLADIFLEKLARHLSLKVDRLWLSNEEYRDRVLEYLQEQSIVSEETISESEIIRRKLAMVSTNSRLNWKRHQIELAYEKLVFLLTC